MYGLAVCSTCCVPGPKVHVTVKVKSVSRIWTQVLAWSSSSLQSDLCHHDSLWTPGFGLVFLVTSIRFVSPRFTLNSRFWPGLPRYFNQVCVTTIHSELQVLAWSSSLLQSGLCHHDSLSPLSCGVSFFKADFQTDLRLRVASIPDVHDLFSPPGESSAALPGSDSGVSLVAVWGACAM